MKPLRRLISIFLILLFTTHCGEDEVSPRAYPRIKTLSVTEISTNGATFHAEVIFRGDFEILDFGFVWDETDDPRVQYSEKVIFSSSLTSNLFSSKVSSALKEGVKYYVKSFIQTEDYTVYGQGIEFISLGSMAPIIRDVSPTTISFCDTITIAGDNFSAGKSNIVKIGAYEAEVIEASDSVLKIKVPSQPLHLESTLSVEVANNISFYEEQLTLIPSLISGLQPKAAKGIDTVTLYGNFGILPTHTEVLFNETSSEIIDIRQDSIRVVVPSFLENPVELKLNIGAQSIVNHSFEFTPPLFKTFTPSIATWNDTITIETANLITNNPELKIYIDKDGPLSRENIYCPIIEYTENSIKFRLPEEATPSTVGLGIYPLVIYVKLGEFNYQLGELDLYKPEVISIEPQRVIFGDEITIYGNWFHPKENSIRLGNTYLEISKNDKSKLQFTLPNNVFASSDGSLRLLIYPGNGIISSEPYYMEIKAPIINEVSPTMVSNYQDEIIIKGENYNSTPGYTTIYWGDIPITPNAVSPNEIRFSINSEHIKMDKIESPLIVRVGEQESFDNTLLFQNSGRWKYFYGDGGSSRNINFTINNHIYHMLPHGNSEWSHVYEIETGYGDPLPEAPFQLSGFYNQISFRKGNNIYIGGSSINQQLWTFNIEDLTWTQLEGEIPFNTDQCSCFEFDDLLYCASATRLYTYDQINNIWETKNEINYETTGTDERIASFFYENKLYLIRHSILYQYNPNDDTWTSLGARNSLADSGKILITNDQIFIHKMPYPDSPYKGTLIRYDLLNDTVHNLEYPFTAFNDCWVGDDDFIYFTNGFRLDPTKL